MAITSAIHTVAIPSATVKKHHQLYKMWFSIYHKNNIMWLFHLPQWDKSLAISQPHGKEHLPITSSGSQNNSDSNICHNQHHKKLAKTYTNKITHWHICQHLAKIVTSKINIVKINIPHTPSKVGVLESVIFSHTPDESMSVGLAKACVP